ncbi:Co2+/Mg2+ efflux protein ApaG [Limnobacter sp. 130]|jgi:ApaG protein|uniref:Co2+/Mg2+ efflux protein ApaG n=1 Tax=unclassified Limnobacter TaxID=2630203 RepID=UPI0012F4049A|nr:Co2+/Mg2+ efflux protein ApaG [Limnobacter sp. 130]VWX32944.1 Protein ApaG [Limnobacter sp. 130]
MSSPSPYQFEVRVSTQFLEEQSDKDKGPYVFAYTIEIENVGERTAQLLSRHWIITDAHNIVQEVKGDGVVGEQPTLRPGESFEYTSGCPLPTPVGTMKGSYTFVGEGGEQFDVPVPEFLLSMPRVLH